MQDRRSAEPVQTDTPANEVHEMDKAQPDQWSQDRLANHLNVSTRTLTRWHKRGLKPVYVLTHSGKKTVRYDHREVLRFVSDQPRLARRAKTFSHMTIAERQNLVALASQMAQHADLGLHEISRRIAEQTGRAVETVRSTLRRFEKTHPDQAIFSRSGSGNVNLGDERISELYDDRIEVSEIAR